MWRTGGTLPRSVAPAGRACSSDLQMHCNRRGSHPPFAFANGGSARTPRDPIPACGILGRGRALRRIMSPARERICHLERFANALHAPRLSPPLPPLRKGGISPIPLRKGGKSAALVFSPLAKGGYRGVLRVPPHCTRLVIQAIENRSILENTICAADPSQKGDFAASSFAWARRAEAATCSLAPRKSRQFRSLPGSARLTRPWGKKIFVSAMEVTSGRSSATPTRLKMKKIGRWLQLYPGQTRS